MTRAVADPACSGTVIGSSGGWGTSIVEPFFGLIEIDRFRWSFFVAGSTAGL